MRSGLQPVATSFNKSSCRDRFAPPVDARARSENASAASNVLRRPILCKKMNVAELASYEVHRSKISKVGTQGVHSRIPVGPGETYAPRVCRTTWQSFLGRPHPRLHESQNTRPPGLCFRVLLTEGSA
jgi:hypothetical protein